MNLFLSMLAGLQGAILLIAAKRQDAIATAMAQHDDDTDLAARAEMEQLVSVNTRQFRLFEQIVLSLPPNAAETPGLDGPKRVQGLAPPDSSASGT